MAYRIALLYSLVSIVPVCVTGCRSAIDVDTGGGFAVWDLATAPPPADLTVPVDFGTSMLWDFGGPGLDFTVPLPPDLTLPPPPDLTPPPPPPDFAGRVVDLAIPPDFTVPPDLAVPPDFTVLPDLTAPTCNDGLKNGKETDVDCGGGTCPACAAGRACAGNGDCKSGSCPVGWCRATVAFAKAAATDIQGVPQSLAADDFNGDGRTDIAVGLFDTGFVGVLLNAGGVFPNSVYSPAGQQPLGIASGDFNRDGKRDVALVGGGALSLVYGRGDGTFGGLVQVKSGGSLVGVRVADINRDGLDDVVYIDRGLVGGGAGALFTSITGANNTIATTVTNKAAANPDALAFGDLDGDGSVDVVLASLAWPGQYQSLRGDGKGNFTAAWTGASGVNPTGVAIGDWNGDGKLDFVGAQSNTDDVGSWMGAGGATFANARTVKTSPTPLLVISADFDLDRRPDLAISCGSGALNTVEILTGNGDGTFTSTLKIAAGSGPGSILAFDANSDGRPDLAVVDGNGQRVLVLQNSSQ